MYSAFLLTAEDDVELTAFLDETAATNPSILGYHYPVYREMLNELTLGESLYVGLKDSSGKLIAMLPGFLKNSIEGSVYSSLPFFGPNAAVLFSKQSHDPQIIHATILSFLFTELQKHNMISASFYSNFFDNDDVALLESEIDNNISIDKFTNYIPLKDFSLNSSLEYDIRKATRMGVQLRAADPTKDTDEIFAIYSKNCADYGIPLKPKACLKYLIEQASVSASTKSYVATLEAKIIGALIMIYSPATASYYLPCSIHEYRSYQPATLLINHAIRESITNGLRYWNWESSPSKESGVYKFKKKWGSLDGSYKVFIKPYKEPAYFKELGAEKINQLFPYYFVYPFNLISDKP